MKIHPFHLPWIRPWAKGIPFRPRIEATKQMTQNWTLYLRGPRISESANMHRSNMYVVVISCFHSTLRLKT